MNGATHVFRLPKAGSSEADYEDAYAVGDACAAIADGATESSFARAWAEALVQGFVSANAESERESSATDPAAVVADFRQRIAPLQKAWHERIVWDRLPWFAEDKARSGAFAALLTLRFDAAGDPPSYPVFPDAPTQQEAPEAAMTAGLSGISSHPVAERPWAGGGPDSSDQTTGRASAGTPGRLRAAGRWRALAIGDCCLFQIRADALLVAFPIDRAEQFGSRPLLLSSNPARNERVWDSVAQAEGDVQPGDLFLLASDALAHWFLNEMEAGNRPWNALNALRSHTEFEALVARLRRDQAMRNDDVTLVRIQTPSAVAEPPEIVASGANPLTLYRRRLLRSRGRRRA